MEAERYFSEFLNQSPSNYQGVTLEELSELLQYRCSEEKSVEIWRLKSLLKKSVKCCSLCRPINLQALTVSQVNFSEQRGQ